jgi:hypothetical protein
MVRFPFGEGSGRAVGVRKEEGRPPTFFIPIVITVVNEKLQRRTTFMASIHQWSFELMFNPTTQKIERSYLSFQLRLG